MEHEVYVPFPVGTVRQALTEPERVARCVPGVQLDADADPHRPEGRLRLRVGSSTITYRGALTVSGGAADGGTAPLTVEATGAETRGDGAVSLTLTVRLSAATEPGPGTLLTCRGTVRSDGRLADADGHAARTAGRRLLDRFAENLAADLEERPVTESEAGAGPVPQSVLDTEVPPPPSPAPLSDAEDDVSVVADAEEEAAAGVVDDFSVDEIEDVGDVGDVEDVEDVIDGDDEDDLGDEMGDELAAPDDVGAVHGAVPAEAAHARRTMIGRSAEEVDHAPPRGRYAPVPAPETSAGSATLRWAAPAAAVVLASAVVVGRVLRRRR